MRNRSNIWTIVRKEFARFFGDRTMVFTVLLMPGLLIYCIYSLIGNNMEKQFSPDETTPTTVFVENLPASVAPLFDSLPYALVQPVLGTIGDLTASVMKRQLEIKDFGNLMPGHGGLLDRFDSVLLVLPFFCAYVQTIDFINLPH